MQHTQTFVQQFVPQMDANSKVYELFVALSYPKDKLLDPSYKRDIKEFEFAKEEVGKIKNIHTVFSLDGRLSIFLIEATSFSAPFIRYLAKVFSDRYQRLLLIITTDYKEYALVFPEFERIGTGKHKLKVTKLIFDRENPYRTDLETILNLSLTGKEKNWRDIWFRWKDAFSVERVTREFFEEYKSVFFNLRGIVEEQKIPRREAHEFTQQLLNRLMFLYFIAKKRWLDNNPKFIKWYWERHKKAAREGSAEKDTFFDGWLRILFLEAFNNRFSHPAHLPQDIRGILQMAPYLNGGLFKENDLDSIPVHLNDTVFEEIFGFLEKYNFTIREDLPLDVEVAVDPEMLGKVYESLVNISEEASERGDIGIFYTPRVEVDFMCRSTVVEYLHNHLEDVPKDVLYHFVFDEDKKKAEDFFTKKDLWYKLEELLDYMDIIDPACGSGAFLVGILKVLVELYGVIFHHTGRKLDDYELKKRIIGSNLYGVDVMAWAVHTAELRLWLQLVVESDLAISQLKLEPLLPNLNLKLRVGDSLVQEIGGISLHLRNKDLSASLKRKLSHLKQEKEKFYKNDRTCKFKTDKDIIHEETRLFSEIVHEEIVKLTKERQKLEGDKAYLTAQKEAVLKGLKTPGISAKEPLKKGPQEIEKQQEGINAKIQALQGVSGHLKDPKKRPFVWDIDFAEIFGDKGGFDIVIGNPPYVRSQKIADPTIPKEDLTPEKKREYKERLIKSVQTHFPSISTINRNSDNYIYFYFIGLSLLNQKGAFCFITSNSWLDVGYGKDLQEFLLKYVPIRAIYDNQAKRSFSEADVNTIIALFGSPQIGNKGLRWTALNNTARFAMFKKPFEEAINSENLVKINKAEKVLKNHAFRVYPKTQEELLEEGWEVPEEETLTNGKFITGKYVGNKLGGKYLRAPDIFFAILEKGEGKLVRLGDIADVRRGFTTGADDWFYLTQEEAKAHGIEKRFLCPILTDPGDGNLPGILVTPNQADMMVINVHEDTNSLRDTNLLKWIRHGEKVPFKGRGSSTSIPADRPTMSGRKRWYELPIRKPAPLLWIEVKKRRSFTLLNEARLLADRSFYDIIPKTIDSKLLCALMNCTATALFCEIQGNAPGGSGAGIQMPCSEVRRLPILMPSLVAGSHKTCLLNTFEKMCKRPMYPMYEEAKQSDRCELDNIVFDILHLTRGEREEVYRAVAELVKQRLEKAKSL